MSESGIVIRSRSNSNPANTGAFGSVQAPAPAQAPNAFGSSPSAAPGGNLTRQGSNPANSGFFDGGKRRTRRRRRRQKRRLSRHRLR